MYEPSIGDIIPDPPGPPMTRGTLLCSTGLLTPHSLTPFTPPRCLHSHDSCQDRPAPRYRQDKALISFSERLQEHKWIWPQFHFTKLCCTEMRLWDCSIACHSVPGLTLSLIIPPTGRTDDCLLGNILMDSWCTKYHWRRIKPPWDWATNWVRALELEPVSGVPWLCSGMFKNYLIINLPIYGISNLPIATYFHKMSDRLSFVAAYFCFPRLTVCN